MAQTLSSKIRRVDDELHTLVERRGTSDSPLEELRAMETIDDLLDERLQLMNTQRDRGGERKS
ncbi:hypothetical protein G1H11_01935 [Phytoactinopolyspora alkaliphila]|uniref:Uncharacterized protein n=1 Tax=Phytoactinopolyspora alkaliphila TaxID=1783498 RepID=A0A6N9YGH7_9ACTN|nr:hypothetical protein [Phytoactinopolyspora alkaliphila]NED94064.1 hypothetical protein [Phytoactinopolyspora alkaliphila]